MGLWLAAGWGIALLLGAAAIAIRRLRTQDRVPRRTRTFLAALRTAFREWGDGAELTGLVPGRFTAVVCIDGQETPIPLRPLQSHWDAFPSELGHVVAQLCTEIRAEGLDRANDFEFGELATDILPQIRSATWLRENSPAFGDGRLVHRMIGADLAVCYVIDDAWSMVFVCEAHLRRWGRTEADLFGLARRNLAEHTDADIRAKITGGGPIALRTDDGYAAARLLLLDPERSDDLLIALPDRDVLWIGEADGADLGDLMARSAQECASSPRPVSPRLYRMDRGELEVVG